MAAPPHAPPPVYMYRCMCVQVHVCTCRRSVCVHVCMCTRVYVYTRRVYVYMCVCVHGHIETVARAVAPPHAPWCAEHVVC